MNATQTLTPKVPGVATAADEALNAVLESLGRIRFGSISITLHEGRIVQLDITEKRRVGR